MKLVVSSERPSCWDELVHSCAGGTFYHSMQNVEIISAQAAGEIKWIACWNGDRLAGGCVFAIKEGQLGLAVNCLPYFGSYGEVLTSPDVSSEVEKNIYEKLKEECVGMGALCLNVNVGIGGVQTPAPIVTPAAPIVTPAIPIVTPGGIIWPGEKEFPLP